MIPLINFEICQPQDIAVATATSTGVQFTTSATVNTKSTYTELVASTSADIGWIDIAMSVITLSHIFECCAVDIAIGAAASEVVIISNLVMAWGNTNPGGGKIALPITIPAGSRISFRYQASNPGDTIGLVMHGYTANFQYVSSYEDLGFVSSGATHGTQVNPSATANTKGSYTQIISATARDYVGMFFCFDEQDTNLGSKYLYDIAIGAAASEVVISPDWFVWTEGFPGQWSGYLPIAIPSGTRIAARSQCSGTSQSGLKLTVYGAVG